MLSVKKGRITERREKKREKKRNEYPCSVQHGTHADTTVHAVIQACTLAENPAIPGPAFIQKILLIPLSYLLPSRKIPRLLAPNPALTQTGGIKEIDGKEKQRKQRTIFIEVQNINIKTNNSIIKE